METLLVPALDKINPEKDLSVQMLSPKKILLFQPYLWLSPPIYFEKQKGESLSYTANSLENLAGLRWKIPKMSEHEENLAKSRIPRELKDDIESYEQGDKKRLVFLVYGHRANRQSLKTLVANLSRMLDLKNISVHIFGENSLGEEDWPLLHEYHKLGLSISCYKHLAPLSFEFISRNYPFIYMAEGQNFKNLMLESGRAFLQSRPLNLSYLLTKTDSSDSDKNIDGKLDELESLRTHRIVNPYILDALREELYSFMDINGPYQIAARNEKNKQGSSLGKVGKCLVYLKSLADNR